MLIQRTSLQLRNKATLLLGSDGRRLLVLIWVKND
jgi:hypothetical protein